jgi:cob(I)alamin adenosyltransferase
MPRLYTKKGDTGYTSLYVQERSLRNLLLSLKHWVNCPVIGLLYARVGDQSFLRLIQVKLIDISSNLTTLDEQKRKSVQK